MSKGGSKVQLERVVGRLCSFAALLALAVGCSRSSNGSNGGSDGPDSTQPDSSETGGQPTGPSTPEGGSAAPGPSIRITTNLIQPEEVPPIPEGFELLYVTGKDVPGRLEVFLVDGEMLYWAQRPLLWRAPKDGSGDPVAFGLWETTNQGSTLLKDEIYIYWHDGPHLKRKRRETTDLSVSTPHFMYNFPWVDGTLDTRHRQGVEVIDYGASGSLRLMAKDATHVYVASSSCTPIYKLDLETLEAELIELARPEYEGGNTAMAVDETHVYCGNNNYLFRVRKDGADFEILYDAFSSAVRSLVKGPEQLLVMDHCNGSCVPEILGFDTSGGVIEYGKSPEWGGASSYSSPLQFDAERQRLYWGGADWLTALELPSRRFIPWRRMRFTFAFTSDEDHLYWGGELNPSGDNHIVTILRLHKDRLDAAPSPD